MTSPWRKVWRDFWQERARTVFVVLAIALGVAAFSAVLSSYAILTRELNAGYLATNPASATLVTNVIDDDVLRGVRALPGVAGADARRTVRGRIKVGPAQWRNLVLFTVRDYTTLRIGTITPERGAWPPRAGEILIERDAMQVAQAHVGDSVSVKTALGSDLALRVSGTVHDVGQAQARMEQVVYGYVVLDTLARLGEGPYLDELTIQVAGDRFDRAQASGVATRVQRWLERQGHPVGRVSVPTPGEHPHARIMGLLLLAMSTFGIFATLLSGVLVVNLLSAMMASQLRQIGIMKAVGGARWQIAAIYLAQSLLLGVAALSVALPLGMWGGRALCRYMAVFLNFDITSVAVPAWVYVLDAAVGLVIPLLAAAYPVGRGSRIPVREALADAGVGDRAFGTSALDRALARVGGPVRPVLLAARNSMRRRARLALTLATLATGGVFVLSAFNVRASMINTLDRLFASRRFDLSVTLASMYPSERIERAVRQTPGVLRAEGWLTTQAAIVDARSGQRASAAPGGASAGHLAGPAASGRAGLAGSDALTVVALPADTRLLSPEIVKGRGLQAGDTNALVVNSPLAGRLRVGSEVTLGMGPARVTWRVVGHAREPFSGPTGYVPLEYLLRRGGHNAIVNSVRLALENQDARSVANARASLDRALEREGVRAIGSTSTAESRVGYDEHMVMIYVFLLIMAAILLAVGGLGLATTMSLNVLERRREMGVLRAIGATPAMVSAIVIFEGGMVGGASGVIAGLGAWPGSLALGNLLMMAMFGSSIDFRFETTALLAWLALSVALGAAASALPAWRASRRPVREAVSYE